MDFQSAMETFAEAWVAANTQTPLTEAAETQVSRTARFQDLSVVVLHARHQTHSETVSCYRSMIQPPDLFTIPTFDTLCSMIYNRPICLQ